MARNLDPKCKQCRREGEKLFLKGEKCYTTKCPIVRRNYVPGMHGVKRMSRMSNYGTQLREKQKAKRLYGVLERQFVRYYRQAIRQRGNTANAFSRMLELRLDTVVRRLGFVGSPAAARQLVGHGHILVNGKRVTIPSYAVRTGETITVSEKAKQFKSMVDRTKQLEKFDTPSWLLLDAKALSGTVKAEPTPDDMKQSIDMQLIVEFYSR